MRHIRANARISTGARVTPSSGRMTTWISSNAPNIETAAKVAILIRVYGRSHSEVWAVTEWVRFKDMLHGLPRAA